MPAAGILTDSQVGVGASVADPNVLHTTHREHHGAETLIRQCEL